jgi:exodeoxyribonuclease VII small subunit
MVEHLANSASLEKPAADVGSLSFEGALGELEEIVKSLEQGDVDLEDSIALYTRGQALKSHCEAKLKNAETRLEKLVLGAGTSGFGPVGSEKMDA